MRRLRQGFTLLELAVVIAIIMVLTSVGIIMSQDLVPRYRTRKAALTFVAKVNECRMVAIRANRECSIELLEGEDEGAHGDLDTQSGLYWIAVGDGSSNSSSWDVLPMDSFEDGVDDTTAEGVIDLTDEDSQHYARRVSLQTWPTIGGPGVGNTDRIVFDPRGWVTNPFSDFDSQGHLAVTFVNKLAHSKDLRDDFTVYISRGGMARLVTNHHNSYEGLVVGGLSSSSSIGDPEITTSDDDGDGSTGGDDGGSSSGGSTGGISER
jgi:prepilin-type N-terminal cleavage/methylation domain-containing protein